MSQIKIADSPITGKAHDGAVRSRRYESQSLHPSTPGNLACWIITGAIGYASPPCLAIDDWTCMSMVLFVPQGLAMVYLISIALEKGWMSATPSLNAGTVGFSIAIVYTMCWATWGNFATRVFWIEAGVYLSLALEAKLGVFEAAERRIGTLLDL
ncbi:unnamed protein product [Alternaria alternata]